MDTFTININFNNKCNQNCLYCFRNKSKNIDLDKNILYTKIKNLVSTYPYNGITVFTIGIMSELMMAKKQVLEFLQDIPYIMNYFFTEKDFVNVESFLTEIDVSSLEELNKVITTRSFFEFLSKNIDLSKDEYYMEVLQTYTGEKWNIIWLNNYILRKLYSDAFKTKIPSYSTITYFTNGTDLDKGFYNQIKKYYWETEKDVIRIALSIDGPRELHDFCRGQGTYDKVMKTYDYIKKDQMLKLNHIGATITSKIENFYSYFKYFYDTFGPDTTVLFSFVRDNPALWYDESNKNILFERLNNYYDQVEEDIKSHKNLDLFKFYLSNRFLNAITILETNAKCYFRCEIEKQFYIDDKGIVTNCFNNNFKINITKEDTITLGHPIKYMEHLDVNRLEFCKDCTIKGTTCSGPCYANLTKDPNYVKIECNIMHLIHNRCENLLKLIKQENLTEYLK